MVFEEKLKQFELQNITEGFTIMNNVLGFLQLSSENHLSMPGIFMSQEASIISSENIPPMWNSVLDNFYHLY